MDKQPDIDTLLGSAVYSFVSALIAASMTPTQAVQRVGFAIIEGTLGRDVARGLGIPRPTMSRWRRELAEIAEENTVNENEVAVAAMNVLLPALGLRDMRIVQGGDKDDG